MKDPVVVVVEMALLPQVAREILALTDNPDLVQFTHHQEYGNVLLVEAGLASRWAEFTDALENAAPVKRKPGRPRKNPSASLSEESS